MKGDFSRDSFDPGRDYTRVMLQQGRVLLDADWNEQVAILLHRLEQALRDMVGPHGGPVDNCGFEILPEPTTDFRIGPGRYYVGGMPCENRDETLLFSQQWHQSAGERLHPGKTYLIYLDAWETYLSADQDHHLREPALGGADTSGRSKVVWRVRAWDLDEHWRRRLCHEGREGEFHNKNIDEEWPEITRHWQPHDRGWLKARVTEQPQPEDLLPSILPPASGYRGVENQLYRVEVHEGGQASEGGSADRRQHPATFKWSRENGSVVFPVLTTAGPILTVGTLGRDLRNGLAIGDWVELVDPRLAGLGRAGTLFQIADVRAAAHQVTLVLPESGTVPTHIEHMLLRRWDQKAGQENRRGLQLHQGAALIVEGEGDTNWLTLEDGVQVQFQKGGNRYRPGDYWLIPARVADGGTVDWPRDNRGRPQAVHPRGVLHHYAPIGVITTRADSVNIECYSRIKFRMSLDRPSLTRG